MLPTPVALPSFSPAQFSECTSATTLPPAVGSHLLSPNCVYSPVWSPLLALYFSTPPHCSACPPVHTTRPTGSQHPSRTCAPRAPRPQSFLALPPRHPIASSMPTPPCTAVPLRSLPYFPQAPRHTSTASYRWMSHCALFCFPRLPEQARSCICLRRLLLLLYFLSLLLPAPTSPRTPSSSCTGFLPLILSPLQTPVSSCSPLHPTSPCSPSPCIHLPSPMPQLPAALSFFSLVPSSVCTPATLFPPAAGAPSAPPRSTSLRRRRLPSSASSRVPLPPSIKFITLQRGSIPSPSILCATTPAWILPGSPSNAHSLRGHAHAVLSRCASFSVLSVSPIIFGLSIDSLLLLHSCSLCVSCVHMSMSRPHCPPWVLSPSASSRPPHLLYTLSASDKEKTSPASGGVCVPMWPLEDLLQDFCRHYPSTRLVFKCAPRMLLVGIEHTNTARAAGRLAAWVIRR